MEHSIVNVCLYQCACKISASSFVLGCHAHKLLLLLLLHKVLLLFSFFILIIDIIDDSDDSFGYEHAFILQSDFKRTQL